MKILKLGKISNSELADWFGINVNNLSKHKTQKLKQLQEYARFNNLRGGVEILEIYQPIYSNNNNYKIMRDNFCNSWDDSGLDSCSRVSNEIYEQHQDELTIARTTAYDYTRAARDELYGKPMSNKKGLKGISSYIWCKKNKEGRLVFLSKEEEDIKTTLLKKYFGTADEKTAIVKDMVDKQEIKPEEAWQYYDKIMNLKSNFAGFMEAFKQQTGIQLIRGTVIEDTIEFTEEITEFNF